MSGLVSFFSAHLGLPEDPSESPAAAYAKSVEEIYAPDHEVFETADVAQEKVPWGVWKDDNKKWLADFLRRRFMLTSEEFSCTAETSRTDENDHAGDDGMSDAGDESQDHVETQPLAQESKSEPTTRHTFDSGSSDCVVHVNDTRHDVSYLSDLSFSTRQLVSCKGMVENIRKERLTRRLSLQNTTQRSMKHDGPLAFAYRNVVSFEMVQKLHGGDDELRQRAQHCLLMCEKTKNRIKVFLYHNYGSAFSEVLKENENKSRHLALLMKNIPAQCIFPYGTLDWFEEDMPPFCICIADLSSHVKLHDNCMRFDDGLCLRFQYTVGDIQEASGKVFVLEPSEDAVFFREDDESESLVGNSPAKATQANAVTPPGLPASEEAEAESSGNANPSNRGNAPEPNRRRAPGSGSAKRTPDGSPKTYYKLAQLRDVFQRQKDLNQPEMVHFYAVVLEFAAPCLTKRGDWMVKASLIDGSIPLHEHLGGELQVVQTFSINMFHKQKERLPDLRSSGDVLRLHRSKVQEFHEEIQLLGQRGTSYVVFRGDPQDPSRNDGWTVSGTSSDTQNMGEDEKTRFVELWRWGQNRILSFPTMKVAHRTMISDMLCFNDPQVVEGDRDFTVMVGAMIPIPQQPSTAGITPRGLLRVWDGTGQPRADPIPSFVPVDVSQAVLNSGEPPAACLDKLSSIVDRIRVVKQRRISPPKAVTGRIVNVAIWEDPTWELVTSAVQIGSFIRLRFVRESILHGTGIRCLHVGSKSYITPLPDLTYEVILLLEAHNTRLMCGEPINPSSGVSSLRPDELPVAATVQPPSSAAVAASRLSRVVPTSTAGQVSMEAPPKGSSSKRRKTAAGHTCDTLLSLMTSPSRSVFTGTVRITGMVPPICTSDSTTLERIIRAYSGVTDQAVWLFAASLDDSTCVPLQALFNNAAGEVIMGMPATIPLRDRNSAMLNLEASVRDGRAMEAKVRSVEHEGAMYFVVDWVSEIAF